MLKKDRHESTWQPVVNRDESHVRTWQHVAKRDTCHELKHGPVGRRLSNTRQLGCVFQDLGAAEANLTEELRHAEANATCEIHKGYCSSHQISRPKSFARIYLPR